MIQLDSWQEDVLKHNGDLLLCTGRRVGKTYILSRKAIDHMMHKQKQIIVVSLTEDQAMLIIAMALAYAREAYPNAVPKGGKFKPTLKSIFLQVRKGSKNDPKNYVRLISRPVGNTGDAMRGFEGGVLIVDEASRMPSLFWIAAKPVLLTQAGEIWMCSTPHGKRGYFWDKFDESYIKQDPKARFKVFYTSTTEVINNRPLSSSWTKEQREGALRILEEDRREMSQLEFGQEYEGLFLDDLQQFFSDELINKCCIIKRPLVPVKPTTPRFMGVDLARKGGDQTTIEIITAPKTDPESYYHVENIAKTDLTTVENENLIKEQQEIWKCDKIGLDAGAGTLGVSILDHLLEDWTLKRRLVAMNNREIALDREGNKTQRMFKEDMYQLLRSMMERGIVYLLDDPEIKTSLKSVQFEFEKDEEQGKGTGKIRIFGQDTHICEGVVRALWLAKKEKGLNIWMRSFNV